MKSNSVKNYFIQFQQLFGDNLILSSVQNDFFVIEEGNQDAKILFIRKSLSDNFLNKEEKKLFNKILKALNLSYNDIFLMSLSEDQKNTTFSLSFNKVKPLLVVIFGSSISKKFLSNNYKGINIISTYSLIEVINDPNLKKYVWKDLKPILDI